MDTVRHIGPAMEEMNTQNNPIKSEVDAILAHMQDMRSREQESMEASNPDNCGELNAKIERLTAENNKLTAENNKLMPRWVSMDSKGELQSVNLKDILTLKSLSQYGSMLDSYDLDQLKKLADDNKLEEQLKNLGMIKPYHRKRLLRAVKNNLHDPVVLLKQEIEDLKIKFMFLKEQIEGFSNK